MPILFEGMQVRDTYMKINNSLHSSQLSKAVFQHCVPWLVEPVSNAIHNCIQTFKIVLTKVLIWGTRVMTLKRVTDNIGLAKLASFHVALRLVVYLTNIDSANHNSTASICSKFEPCMVVLAFLHVRVWLCETSFREWQHARYNCIAYKNLYGHDWP